MTGINLNVQNSYAALYNTTQTQANSPPRSANAASTAESSTISRGEKLTLSAEAIALSLQIQDQGVSDKDTILGGGDGIRPPAANPLGGGDGIRPPAANPLGGGDGIRPPAANPLGGGDGIRPPEANPLGGGDGIRPPFTS